MKKLLSFVLALIMATSVSVIGFAHENVDNTFDNFIPAPGVQAPDNWYDPFAYDEEGLISFNSLAYEGIAAYYCKHAQKLFVPNPNGTAGGYSTLSGVFYEDSDRELSCFYCPYCGDKELPNRISFLSNHEGVEGVAYGFYCTECGDFCAYYGITHKDYSIQCNHCGKYVYPELYYRFTSDTQKNSDYSYLFEETAYKYGEGEDGRIEDLVKSSYCGFKAWKNDPQKQPNAFVRFFRNIKNAFSSFFKRIANLFK